jgi:hypothetical protein
VHRVHPEVNQQQPCAFVHRRAHSSHELQIVGRREHVGCVRHKQNIMVGGKRRLEHVALDDIGCVSSLALPAGAAVRQHKPRQLKQRAAQIRIASQHGQQEPLTNVVVLGPPITPKRCFIADRSQGVRMPVSWRIASVDEDTASKQTSCTPCQALHADGKSVESVTSFHLSNSARSDASLSSTSFTASDPSRRCAGGSSACASFTIAAAARLGSPS